MDYERTLIIGDVHGCLEMLKELVDKIQWQPGRDRLIFLGDYIDRGENPKGVVDYILGLQRQCRDHEIDCLVGNHEVLLLNYLEGRDRRLFFINGGWRTMESYGAEERNREQAVIPDEHLTFYRSLKTFVELEHYYVVHAGFRPGVPVQDQALEDMVWIRDPFIFSSQDFGKKVIFGHTPFYQPLEMPNKIGLDTGAVYRNCLTCFELPEGRFHHVEA